MWCASRAMPPRLGMAVNGATAYGVPIAPFPPTLQKSTFDRVSLHLGQCRLRLG